MSELGCFCHNVIGDELMCPTHNKPGEPPHIQAFEYIQQKLWSNKRRADALRQHALLTIFQADNTGSSNEFRCALYAQASAYLALEHAERTHGVIDGAHHLVDEYFKQFGEQHDS